MTTREFDALLKHSGFMRALARSLLHDEHEADDVVQQTWLRALQRPPRKASRSWLVRVLRNNVHRIVRTRTRRQRRERAAARSDHVPSTAETLQQEQALRAVLEAVLGLDEPYRSTLLMRFYEDLPPREIARRQGVAVETVRSRVRRAIQRVRRRLDRNCDGDRSVWALGLLPFAAARRINVPANLAGAIAVSKTKLTLILVLPIAVLLSVWTLTQLLSHEQGRRVPPQERAATQVNGSDVAGPELSSGTLDPPQIDRDRDLHGIVARKSDGAPIAGARLQAVRYPWQRTNMLNYEHLREEQEGPSTISDSDGRFALRLRSGDLVALRCSAKGYAPRELAVRQAGERVRIELSAGVRLVVVARDEDGTHVAGVRVRLMGPAPRGGQSLMDQGVTNTAGVCVLEDLPSDVTAWISGEHASFAPAWPQVVALPGTGEHSFHLTLRRGRTLEGKVTDAATGWPIEGARVGMAWVILNESLTDAEGRFTLHGWTGEGVQHVHVVADGYGRASRKVGVAEVLDVKLERGDAVTGRILDQDRNPVPGARTAAIGYTRRDESHFSSRSGRSDADGRFSLDGLRRDMPHTLIVMAEGRGRYLLDFDPHRDGAGTVDLGDIVLPLPHTIAGRVVDSHGHPVQDIRVDLNGHNGDRARLRGAEQIFNPYGQSEQRFTDDLGRFRFPDLSPGHYRVFVSPRDVEPISQEVELEEGKDRFDIEITLREVRAFRVTVTDRSGAPLANVRVAVQTEAGLVSGQTDSDGQATTMVTSRVAKVYAYPPAQGQRTFFFKQQGVSGDPDQVHLVLEEGQVITGRVLAPEGGPLARAVVQARRAGRDVARAVSDEHGRFKATVPAGGEALDFVLIGVRLQDGTMKPHAFEAEAKGVVAGSGEVVLRATRVTADRALLVKLVYPDGSPVIGARLFIAGFTLITTNGKGEGLFRRLPAKEITIRALPPDGLEGYVAPLPRKVVPNGGEVVLRLRTAAKITGEVVRLDGSPATKATVRLGRERLMWTAATDERGHFEIHVPAEDRAPWTLTATLRVGRIQLQGTRKGIRAGDSGVRIELEEHR